MAFGQIWLPDAHPAAPSPVSALLSGVMIKTGVYGLMRYFLWLVPAEAQALYPAGAWGTVLLLLGTVTLFTGTVQALHQDTSKRLLAYSSIGQAGYILLGLGTCLLLLPAREPALAALASVAFGGALFHTVNHGIFKSLLFLNAGSVLHATGTQDLNKLGGLMRFMPLTAVTAMVATFAIAGVPLFSGFASKWSMYVAAIQGHGVSAWLPLCTIVAMLTSAITLALFLKFFGSMFLSRTSTLVATRATRPGRLEVNWQMRAAQLVLAGICLVFGLVPALGTGLVRHALHASRQGLGEVLAGNMAVTAGAWTGLAGTTGAALYAPLGVGLVLALLFVLVRALARLGGAARRPAVPWLCGYAQEADLHRYRASGLYGELKRGWCRINVLASLWAAGRKGFAGPRAQPVVPPTPAPPQPVEITS